MERKHIAIYGKLIRSSKRKQGSSDILSVWMDDFVLSVAQKTVQEKCSELQAIPELLDSLKLTGSVVNIDAMRTQTVTAKQIVSSGGDYILSLKSNQKHLFKNVQASFTGKYKSCCYEILEARIH